MLRRLTVRDVVLIDTIDLTLQPNLTALTGETGAGKSIVLDAVALAIGARAEQSLLRAGSDAANVTAEFTLTATHPVWATLDEACIPHNRSDLLIRRQVQRDGKSRAFINDQLVTVNLLKKVAEPLLEIQGQFEQHGLLEPTQHRHILDDFATLQPQVVALGKLYDTWQSARATQQRLETAAQDAAREQAYWQDSVAELNELAPQDDEETLLSARRLHLQQQQKRLDSLQNLQAAYDEHFNRGLAQLNRLSDRMIDTPAKEALSTVLQTLNVASDELHTLLYRLQQAEENQSDTLEAVEERLFRLREVARKHRCQPAELPQVLATLQANLQGNVTLHHEMTQATQATQQAASAYHQAATSLHAARVKAAQHLAKLVNKELPPLKLVGAVFSVQVSLTADPAAHGLTAVQFMVQTNPGTPVGALQKIASGGELSRLLLGLRVVLAAANPVGTLILDEIDAGVGGATAEAIGERLKRLAQTCQVIVVTHSPQVAASATHHYHVSKQAQGKTTRTNVVLLNPAERVEEIARMLAGSEVTKAARAAATSLLTAHAA